MTVDPLIGQILDGRYQVLSHLGEGGMGAVYKAEHIAMAQAVAIKVLLTETANDPSMVKRFIREARSCFRIDHPNCVRVTDFGSSEGGALYFAMEYLDGRTLGIDLHVDGPMKSARVRHIASQVALALGHAHSLGLVHRDLKPANIMLVQRDGDPDFVKVFDFGLGKLVDEGAQLTGLTMSPLTQEGIVFGTPEYMSPEQARGDTLGPASDIYTLGVCCYEMLTGHLPFEGKTFTEILSKHVAEAPMAPSERFPQLCIDWQIEALVLQCLSKDASERPTASDLAEGMRSEPPPSTRTASSLASSETLVVSEASMAKIDKTPAAAASRGGGAGFLPSQTKSYKRHIALGAVAAAAIGFFALRSAPSGVDEAASVATAGTGTQADANVPPRDAAVAPGANAEAQALTRATDASSGRTTARPRKATARKAEPIPDPHLEAAEAAHRSGNVLKQLSEANASLKSSPKGRRAAFLVGDALVKSGDKVAACTFFRRAGRKHFRAAGCSD